MIAYPCSRDVANTHAYMGSTSWPQGVILKEGRRGGGEERRGSWERGMEGGVYPVVVEVRKKEWCIISRNIVFICEIKNNEH